MGGCLGDALPERWWRDPEHLQREVRAHGNRTHAAKAHGVSPGTVAKAWSDLGLHELPSGRPAERVIEPAGDDVWLLEAIRKAGDKATVHDLADLADVSPRRVREGLGRLGDAGYRIAEDEGRVELVRIAPDKHNLHPGLLAGETIRLGVVSDTHLNSNEEALPELHLAYDTFAAEGIAEVLHAGDLIAGRGIFRGQDGEIKNHTLDAQVAYAVEHYPRRDGITTRIIAGNHDVEGEAGRVGFDPVSAFANQRDDVDYLGPFSAWIGAHGGAWIHLLHGKGGMSYAYSYKAQKLVDGYPAGRKPSVLIVGHWHVRGNFDVRDVEVLFPGCFEWQSPFMQRLGLRPWVGFHILELTFGDDGSLVSSTARKFKFHEGRVIA